MRWFFSVLMAACVFFSFQNFSLIAEDEIVVRLSTEVPLVPMYIGKIQQGKPQKESAPLKENYLEEMRSVLVFDCNNNGYTTVVSAKGEVAKIETRDAFTQNPDFDAFKKAGVPYLITLQTEDRSIKCKVVSINGHTIKQIDGPTLTGDPTKDRILMHRLSDTIFELLFHKKGIASSKLIYTLRTKTKEAGSKKGSGASWISEVWESDYDGSNAHKLFSDGASIVTPAYQPGTTTTAEQGKNPAFCYVSYKIGQSKIFFVSKNDGKAKRLTSLRGNQMTPAISPDRNLIAFVCDTMGTCDLFLQPFHPDSGAIGKPRQIYTSRVGAQASPTFSPDGKRIAFVSGKDGSPKIYMMEIPKEGAKLQDMKPLLVSKKCRENSSPSWSPDGKKIAYSAKSSGPRQIWVYDVDTKEERQLTDGAGDKESPVFAQDSLHLVFHVTDKGGSELFLANLNQSRAVKISQGPGEKRFPVWK